MHERTVHCSTRQKEGSRLLAERCWRKGDHWGGGGVPWGSGVCGGGGCLGERRQLQYCSSAWLATLKRLGVPTVRTEKQTRLILSSPRFAVMSLITIKMRATASESVWVCLPVCVCEWERERKNERGSGKERDHCLRWNKEISTEPLWTGKAGKCTKMQGLVSYSWAVTSCQEPTNSDVQMQTALPSDIHCTPVIYYILTSVTLACIWTSKRGREWSFSSLAKIRCVRVSLWLLGYN